MERIDRIVPRVAGVLAFGVVVGVIVLFAIAPLGPGSPLDWAATVTFGLIPASYAVTAAVILSKQPRNTVGWALLIPALGFVSSQAISTFFVGLDPVPTSLSWWQLAGLAFENFSWVLLIFPIFHLLLVFPNGELLSPRWRLLVWLEAVMILIMFSMATFSVEIGPAEGEWTVSNPIGFITDDFYDRVLAIPWNTGLLTLTLSGVAALIVRFRRAGRVERQQIKWMMVAVVFFGVTYSIGAINSGFAVGGLADTLLGLSINLLSVAIAFGVLRYRLFDIDRFISRTVGYVLAIGLLVAVYATVAVWLPSRFAGDSPLFVAGATLAVAALFSPVRRAILRWVDRRFYRSRYDMERLVEDFGIHLQSQTDINSLTSDWVGVVAETLQPSAVGVWIRPSE